MVEALLEAERVGKPPVPVERIARSLGAHVRYAPFEGELAGMLIRDEPGRGVVIGVNSLHHPESTAVHYRPRMRAFAASQRPTGICGQISFANQPAR